MDIQQSLFETPSHTKATKERHHWTVFTDGASRNNPGKSGAGIYLVKNGEPFLREGFFLGIKTNNQAEYLALLLGLFCVRQFVQADDTVRVVCDSELLIKQMKGHYRVRHEGLKALYALARLLVQEVNGHMVHVLRTENTVADEMANEGIDKKKIVPLAFVELLKNHDITL
jgi:ribonuclease HI